MSESQLDLTRNLYRQDFFDGGLDVAVGFRLNAFLAKLQRKFAVLSYLVNCWTNNITGIC